MIGDLRHEDLGLHPRHRRRASSNLLGTPPILPFIGRVIPGDEPLQRGPHRHHLFLVDLHAATDGAAVRRPVHARRLNQRLLPDQQPRALWPANALATRERDQVESHGGVFPQVLDRRHIGRSIVHRRNGMLDSKPGELVVLDAPFLVVVVVEEHQCGLVVHRALEIVAGLDLDQPHTAIAKRAVVPESMGLLDDHLALHRGEVWHVADLLPIGSRQHAGSPECQCGSGTRGHHRGLSANEFRDALADAVVQLVEHHVLLRGVVYGVDDLGRHQRGSHGGVGTRRVDERTDAQLPEVVTSALAGGAPSRGVTRAAGATAKTGDDGRRGKALEKVPAAPHGKNPSV